MEAQIKNMKLKPQIMKQNMSTWLDTKRKWTVLEFKKKVETVYMDKDLPCQNNRWASQ